MNNLRNYFRTRIKGRSRLDYMCYTTTFNNLELCFESCGIYELKLICDNFPMTYNFNKRLSTCGCQSKECIHKETLNEFLDTLKLEI